MSCGRGHERRCEPGLGRYIWLIFNRGLIVRAHPLTETVTELPYTKTVIYKPIGVEAKCAHR